MAAWLQVEPKSIKTPEWYLWYLTPGWRSVLAWPIAAWYIGGVVYGSCLFAALHLDVIRWNFVIWLFIGWYALLIPSLLPAFVWFCGLLWTGAVWTSMAPGRWWSLPIKLAATVLIWALAQTVFMLLLIGLSGFLSLLKVDAGSVGAIVEWFSRWDLWTGPAQR